MKLDWLTGGFHAGDFVVVAGRPGMGKTMLLSNIARASAQAGAPTLFVSIEMPREQIIHRLMADLTYGESAQRQAEVPLPFTRFRSGKLNNAQFDQAYAAAQQLRELASLEIYDADGVTIHKIAALAPVVLNTAAVYAAVDGGRPRAS